MYLMRPQSDVSKHKSSSSVNGVQLGDDYDKDSEEGDRDNRFSDISLGRSSSIDEQRARKQSNDEEIYSSFNPARVSADIMLASHCICDALIDVLILINLCIYVY